MIEWGITDGSSVRYDGGIKLKYHPKKGAVGIIIKHDCEDVASSLSPDGEHYAWVKVKFPDMEEHNFPLETLTKSTIYDIMKVRIKEKHE
jgi:hypothetical protein